MPKGIKEGKVALISFVCSQCTAKSSVTMLAVLLSKTLILVISGSAMVIALISDSAAKISYANKDILPVHRRLQDFFGFHDYAYVRLWHLIG